MIYGGSVSQLAANEMQFSAQQRASLERMLERLLQAQQNNQSRNMQRGRDMEQTRQFDETMAYNRDRAADVGMDRVANRVAQISRDADLREYRDRSLALSERQMQLGDPLTQRKAEASYRQAYQLAQDGLFESPEAVAMQFPGLSPEEHQALASVSANTRFEREGDFDFADKAARTMNRLAMLKKQRDLKAKSVQGWHWTPSGDFSLQNPFRTSDAEASADPDVAKMTDEISRLQQYADRFTQDKRLNNLVMPDPETGEYRPAFNLPWRNRQAVRPSTPAAPAAAVAQPSQAAIQYLIQNPNLWRDFDAKYGQGASNRYLP
jgi:hypothetical protein